MRKRLRSYREPGEPHLNSQLLAYLLNMKPGEEELENDSDSKPGPSHRGQKTPTEKPGSKGKKKTGKKLAAQQDEPPLEPKPSVQTKSQKKASVDLSAANDPVPPESFKVKSSSGESDDETDPRPRSTGDDPGTSEIPQHQVTQQKSKRNRKDKRKKRNPVPPESFKVKSSSGESDDETDPIPRSTGDDPGTSEIPQHQVTQQKRKRNRKGKRKKRDKTAAPPQTQLPLKPTVSSPDTTGHGQVTKSNPTEKDSKSNLLNSPEGKNLQKEKGDKITAEKAKEAEEKETIKSSKIEEFASHTSKSIISQVESKVAQEALHKQDETKESEVEATSEKTETLKELMDSAIFGNVEVILNEDEAKLYDGSPFYASYSEENRCISFGDEKAKIYIKVGKGIQVVCNSRRRQVIDVAQNAQTCSGRLEDSAATARPDEDTAPGINKRPVVDLAQNAQTCSGTLDRSTTAKPDEDTVSGINKRPVVDLAQNAQTCSGRLEDSATTAKPDEDTASVITKSDKVTSDDKPDLCSFGETSGRNDPEVEEKVDSLPDAISDSDTILKDFKDRIRAVSDGVIESFGFLSERLKAKIEKLVEELNAKCEKYRQTQR